VAPCIESGSLHHPYWDRTLGFSLVGLLDRWNATGWRCKPVKTQKATTAVMVGGQL